ncbi:MAG TPA: iron-containing alcohol dehydrogenase, partial [Acidimicrobiales bacterium]|nr:iron-containing alcohol dehydrogenase [Acidimicrobiales bacterium]
MAADTAGSSWTHTGLAQQLHFAPRAVERAGEVVRGLRARRVLLMTTEGRLASPAGEALQAALGRVLVTTFAGVRSHVPAAMVEEAVARARDEQVDLVVSFGGGSCADAAKAVCFFMERRAGTPGSSYLDRPVLGHVAIPTTYSGAELTPFFGMTDEAARRKQ